MKKFKRAGIYLIISSIIWIMIESYYLGQCFTEENWPYNQHHLFDVFFPYFIIFVPISLTIFARALINENSKTVEKPSREDVID